jgi:hypothetical protein
VLAILGGLLTCITLPYGISSIIYWIHVSGLRVPIPPPLIDAVKRIQRPIAFPLHSFLEERGIKGPALPILVNLPGYCCPALAVVLLLLGLAIYIGARRRE